MSTEKSRLDLPAIDAPQHLPPMADDRTIAEREDLEEKADDRTIAEKKYLEREREKEYVRGLKQDIDERKKYASHIFLLVVWWLAGVVAILVAHGIRWPWMAQYVGFDLPEAVLIALITTTTGGVVGILLIVARYLFPQRPAK